MNTYKLQIQINDDKPSISRHDFAQLLKKVAWHIENFPHRSPGLVQELHDADEQRVGEYLVVARFED